MTGININKLSQRKNKNNLQKHKKGQDIFEFLNRDIQIFGTGLNNKKKYSFYNYLNILLTSGIDISTAFELVIESFTKKSEKLIINNIKNNIIKGDSFCDALEKTGKFTPYEYYSIKIGEETGKLVDVLKDLAEYFNSKIDQKRKLVSAFSYPVIVFLTAFGAIYFMLSFIVPMFEDIFKRFGGELPGITKFIIQLSNSFSKYSLYIIIIVGIIILLIRIFRDNKTYRRIVSMIILRTPVFGELIRKVHITQFCISMELLISSKTPILNSIQLLKKMIRFYPIESSLEMIESDILKGLTLHESLLKFKVYDKRMTSLVKVAEQVNQLDVIFRKLKEQYTAEISYQTGLISSIMEPLMIIFMGFFVGLILIAMYLPMFKLTTSFAF